MSVSRRLGDDSLRLGDVVHDWCAAWLTPARNEAAPAVLAELQTDGTDVIRIGRAELLALRQRCDELLAANPAGEVIEGELTNDAAAGVPEPPLAHATLRECVPALPPVSPSPRYARTSGCPCDVPGTYDVHTPGCHAQ